MYKKDEQQQQQTDPLIAKELLFSGGAGALCYQIGYVQYLVELIGKEKLKEYKLGGISAGAAVAGLLHSVLYSDTEVSTIYLNKGRRFYENDNHIFFGLITSGDLIYKLSQNWFIENQQKGLPSFNGSVHVYTTIIDGLSVKPLLIDHFHDANDFADAIKASCFLPLICGLSLYTNFRGNKCIDGGVTMPVPYKNQQSYKIYLNVLPDTYIFTGGQMPPNTVKINIYEPSNLKFPLDYWIWKNEWADMMFLKGYLAAKQQENILRKAFQMEEEKKTDINYTF